MGQKLAKAHGVSPDKFLKPRGLYPSCDIDLRKLKRSIVSKRLAPCFPGAEDEDDELEECPICLLHYPALNRTRCCGKGICTECYLQVQTASKEQELCLCPYCKACLHVTYRGPRSASERSEAQVEQQRIFSAILKARTEEEFQSQARMKDRARQKAQQQAENCAWQPSVPAATLKDQACAKAQQHHNSHNGCKETPYPVLTNAQRQAQFVDTRFAPYIPTEILSDSAGFSGAMDLNDVMLMHAVSASMDDYYKAGAESGSRGRFDLGSDSVHPLEPSTAYSSRAEPTIHEALQGGLLDTAASDPNLTSTGKINLSASSVGNMLDTGTSVEGPHNDGPGDAARQTYASISGQHRSSLIQSGEWGSSAGYLASTLSTVSSTSMEVLLSAAADFGGSLLDTGGSFYGSKDKDIPTPLPSSPRDGPEGNEPLSKAATSGVAAQSRGLAASSATAGKGVLATGAESDPVLAARAHASRSETAALPSIAEADAEHKWPSSLTNVYGTSPARQPHTPTAAVPMAPTAAVRSLLSRGASSLIPAVRSSDADGSVTATAQSDNMDTGPKRVTWGIPKGSAASHTAPSHQRPLAEPLPEAQHQRQHQHQQHLQQQQYRQVQQQSPCPPVPPGPHDVHVGMMFTELLPWPHSWGFKKKAGAQPAAHALQSQSHEAQNCAPTVSQRPLLSHGQSSIHQGRSADDRHTSHAQSDASASRPASATNAEADEPSEAAGDHPSEGEAASLVLSPDGGAVLLQDPDGTQHFVLLVSDLKRHAEAQAKADADAAISDTNETYTSPSTPHDAAVREAIARSDELLRQLYARSDPTVDRYPAPVTQLAPSQSSSHAKQFGLSRFASQHRPEPTSGAGGSWLERMRQQDKLLTAALNGRDITNRTCPASE